MNGSPCGSWPRMVASRGTSNITSIIRPGLWVFVGLGFASKANAQTNTTVRGVSQILKVAEFRDPVEDRRAGGCARAKKLRWLTGELRTWRGHPALSHEVGWCLRQPEKWLGTVAASGCLLGLVGRQCMNDERGREGVGVCVSN